MQDDMIVELYWQRDENAIKATEDKYNRYLAKIAYNILKDLEDTKESLNDTYLAAWESIPPHRPSVLSTFLAKLTRRISIDIYRKKNREKRRESQYSLSLCELSDVVSKDEQPHQKLEAELLGAKISKFLQKQKPQVRALFVSRYYFLDPVKEAARACNMTESKAKTVLRRTRLALRDYLEKEGFFV